MCPSWKYAKYRRPSSLSKLYDLILHTQRSSTPLKLRASCPFKFMLSRLRCRAFVPSLMWRHVSRSL
uniref:Uncharacterized protein n=1 Tax=Kalanchoe fedtschenkoi TaxID=63787 RepID=A0A7N1A5J6_KALFE